LIDGIQANVDTTNINMTQLLEQNPMAAALLPAARMNCFYHISIADNV